MSTEGFVSMSKHFQEAHDPGLHGGDSHDDITVDIDIPEDRALDRAPVGVETSAALSDLNEAQVGADWSGGSESSALPDELTSPVSAIALPDSAAGEPSRPMADAGDINAHPALSAIDPQVLQAIRDEHDDKVRAINRQLAVSILGTVSSPINAGDLKALVSYATGDEVSSADMAEILDGAISAGSHLQLLDGRYARLPFTQESTRALILEQFRSGEGEPDNDWPSYRVLCNQVFNETDAPQDEEVKTVLDQTIKNAVQFLVEQGDLAQVCFGGKIFLHPANIGRMIDLDGDDMPIDVKTGERV